MPYVTQERREELDNGLDDGTIEIAGVGAGDLNYLLSRAIDEYIDAHGLSYGTINTVVGVIECMKLELYRRIAAPYEDEKKELNGDVYSCNLNR